MTVRDKDRSPISPVARRPARKQLFQEQFQNTSSRTLMVVRMIINPCFRRVCPIRPGGDGAPVIIRMMAASISRLMTPVRRAASQIYGIAPRIAGHWRDMSAVDDAKPVCRNEDCCRLPSTRQPSIMHPLGQSKAARRGVGHCS